jgi:hypothetical protein
MHKYIKKIVLTGLFMALGVIIPQFFHLFGLGRVWLPMHLPVLVCGIIVGWQYGLIAGFTVPFLSMIITGMPSFPDALPMSFELGAYGASIGLLFRICRPIRNDLFRLYVALLGAMIAGRIIYGLVSWAILLFQGNTFAFRTYLTAVVLGNYPGIILQLALVPPFLYLLRNIPMSKVE